jgi:hypothetical protein
MVKTFVFKLKPTRVQADGLERYLRVTRGVYNAALEQRIAAWSHGKHRSWIDQSREIADLRTAGFLEGRAAPHQGPQSTQVGSGS